MHFPARIKIKNLQNINIDIMSYLLISFSLVKDIEEKGGALWFNLL